MAFMIHPDHGATYTSDVEGHEKNGWKESTPEEWLAKKKGVAVFGSVELLPQVEIEPMVVDATVRPGRPKKSK